MIGVGLVILGIVTIVGLGVFAWTVWQNETDRVGKWGGAGGLLLIMVAVILFALGVVFKGGK